MRECLLTPGARHFRRSREKLGDKRRRKWRLCNDLNRLSRKRVEPIKLATLLKGHS